MYSWAIPTESALDFIMKQAQGRIILEIGCGNNRYWANLLETKGQRIITVDNNSIANDSADFADQLGEYDYHVPSGFLLYDKDSIIPKTGEQYLLEHSGCKDNILFVCFPRHDLDNFVSEFKGDKIIFIGEPFEYGYTGVINTGDWRLVEEFEIPVWPGMRDILAVYERK